MEVSYLHIIWLISLSSCCTNKYDELLFNQFCLKILGMIEPVTRFSKVLKTFRARKAICEPANRLFRKADLLRFFQGNKKQTDCEV